MGMEIGKSSMRANMAFEVISPRIVKPRFLVSSIWEVEHFRRKARGAMYDWALISKDRSHNLCTNEGLDRLLDVMFHGTTQITAWYVGLFEDDYTPLATNTYATPGCTESTTGYDEATRPAYTEAAASSRVTTNAANKAAFTFNTDKTIYGGILVGGGTGAATKGDAAGGGALYCSCRFSSSKTVADDDVLNVTVALTAADA
jgi:hypothetical protein